MTGVWEPNRPELDTNPPWDLGQPARTYVVCATPRSGSGLLLRGMAATGLAGTPAEYFHVQQREPLAARWGAGDSPRAYTTALRRHRTSRAGVLGIKLHWAQLESLRAEIAPQSSDPADALFELFPDARLIHIRRRDLDRQAISLWRAVHTRIWVLPMEGQPPGEPEPAYDFAEIERYRGAVARSLGNWTRLFERRGIHPVEVAYEDLVAAFEATVADVVERVLGTRPASVPPPDSRPQRDARTEALLERYTRERLDRGL